MMILPIDSFLPTVLEKVKTCRSVILLAEPGAGKSTRVPIALVKTGKQPAEWGHWILLQPRRWAARLVAERIAQENQLRLGEEIGVQIRFENRTSSKTRLWVMTEGILLRRLQEDPTLEGQNLKGSPQKPRIEGVILDEFHERSLDIDLSLALLKELQDSFRPDLKIVVMSATLDPAALQSFLPESEVIRVPGRVFPVEKIYLDKTAKNQSIADAFEEILNHPIASESEDGDGLVFLPGAYEIDRAIRDVHHRFPKISRQFDLLPLHSKLPEAEQKKVFEDKISTDSKRRRKIIFSTNVAETSITLPFVKFVVDSGLSKVMRTDAQAGQDRLELVRISRASADQRAGRAGRVSAGVCFRLWTEAEQSQLRHQETPEVHRVSLSSSFLFLASQGVTDPAAFAWFDPPRSSAVLAAKQELANLGLIQGGRLTPDGLLALQIPLPPEAAKLMIASKNAAWAARLTTWMEESSGSDAVIDWDSLLRSLNSLSGRSLQIAKQILGPSTSDLKRIEQTEVNDLEQVMIQAMPNRVFINGKKVGRRSVQAENKNTVLPEAGFILKSKERDQSGSPVILIQSWLPISLKSLRDQANRKITCQWDASAQRVRAFQSNYFMDLALDPETEVRVPEDQLGPILEKTLLAKPLDYFLSLPEFANWWKRYQGVCAENQSEQNVESILDFPWKDLVQSAISFRPAMTRISEVLEFPWKDFLMNSFPEFRIVDQLLPEKIEVPSGSWIAIDYDGPPKLSVRLQEVFGWLDTPTVMNGKIPLVMELLAPNFRPIQLTRDLRSFWKNAYFEVKRELKIRYPKHAWPEDPLTAKPEAKGRRRPPI